MAFAWCVVVLVVVLLSGASSQRSCNLRQLDIQHNPTASARVNNDRFPRCETALSWPTDSTCHINCSFHDVHAWTHYQCRDGIWFSARLPGELCPTFRKAGCQVSADGAHVRCDACASPVPESNLLSVLPIWPGAELRHLTVRCHQLKRVTLKRMYVLANVARLDLSNNFVSFISVDGFPFLESLTHLNLSHNRLSTLPLGTLPAEGNLQSLDLRGNNIVAVDAATFSATFRPDCAAPPAEFFVDPTSPCQCALQPRDAPRACNAVNCSCAPAEQEVLCGAGSAERVPASRVCDGKVDCSNCWDESLCEFSFNIASLQLLPECLGPVAAFSTLRGRSTVFSADPSFIQRFCFGLPSFKQFRISFSFESETRMKGILVNEDESAVLFEVYLDFLVGDVARFLFTVDGGAASSAQDFPLTFITCSAPQGVSTTSSSSMSVLGAALGGSLGLVACAVVILQFLSRRRERMLLDAASQTMHNNRQLFQTALAQARQELAGRIARLPTTDGLAGGQAADSALEVPFVASDMLEILQEVGTGNFGAVCEARCKQSGVMAGVKADDHVAVKTLRAKQVDVRGLMIEACLLYALHHPHIVRLHGLTADSHPPGLVLEWAQFGSLLGCLRKQLLTGSPAAQREVGAQVAAALAYLHALGIVHRDLAARNVLVMCMDPMVVKVADFGMGRFVQDNYYIAPATCELPMRWLPPETLTHGKFSTPTDVWSFGVLLWEVMSGGKTPYGHMTPKELVDFLHSGRRLDVPPGVEVHKEILECMRACWLCPASKRPLAFELYRLFRNPTPQHRKVRHTVCTRLAQAAYATCDTLQAQAHAQLLPDFDDSEVHL